ncbi:MAG: DUF4153 domain-containing protein [Bacteroidota bacterium]
MKNQILNHFLLLIGTFWYIFLFTHEILGINVLLFAIPMVGISIYKQPEILHTPFGLMITIGTLLTAIIIPLNGSDVAATLHVFSFLIFVGLAQVRTLRFIWYALVLGLSSIVTSPIAYVKNQANLLPENWSRLFKNIQLLIIPFVVLFVFFFIYAVAFPQIGGFIDSFFEFLESLINRIDSTELVVRFILGILIMGGLFIKNPLSDFVKERVSRFQLNINRKKKSSFKLFSINAISLKREYYTAVLTLAMLNGLLLLVNILNYSNLFVRSMDWTIGELSDFVHYQTYVLLFGISLSILVLLFFFRRNLNFYPNNEKLRWLANAWIFQNGLLTLLTIIRVFQYIDHGGLAFQRFWLMIFLILTSIGLITMYIKIKDQKSIFYLFVTNGWAWYMVFFIVSCFNLNIVFTKFNLQHNQEQPVDLFFLSYDVGKDNLYLLQKNKDLILKRNGDQAAIQLEEAINSKRRRNDRLYEDRSWKSWSRMMMKNYDR